MALKFSFDLQDYKKTFVGLIVESEVKENPTAPADQRNQYWSLGIVHLERDGDDWTPQGGKCMFELNPESQAVCPFTQNGLTEYHHTFHNHYRVWAGETPTSPAAKLLLSFQDKAKMIVTSPADVLGKAFKWEEIVTPPYKKKDGTLSNNGRSYYNYLVTGPLTPDGIEEVTPPEEMATGSEDLPWDPPATPANQPAATANGVTELSADDIDMIVAGLLDGKTVEEGKSLIRGTPELFGNPQFRLLFLQNRHTEGAEKKGILALDSATGRYKAQA